MSKFIEAFERGTEGMEAFSTGVCSGCMTCAGDLGYRCEEDENGDEEHESAMMARFAADVETGKAYSESHFSWGECDICGSRLGGDREPGHYVADGRLHHVESVCVDCIMYSANGEEPEMWGR